MNSQQEWSRANMMAQCVVIRHRRIAAGQCAYCRQPHITEKQSLRCRACKLARIRKGGEWSAAGLCLSCGENSTLDGWSTCEACLVERADREGRSPLSISNPDGGHVKDVADGAVESWRWGPVKTHDEIAARTGVTRSRVGQIEEVAVRKIKAAIIKEARDAGVTVSQWMHSISGDDREFRQKNILAGRTIVHPDDCLGID